LTHRKNTGTHRKKFLVGHIRFNFGEGIKNYHYEIEKIIDRYRNSPVYFRMFGVYNDLLAQPILSG